MMIHYIITFGAIVLVTYLLQFLFYSHKNQ